MEPVIRIERLTKVFSDGWGHPRFTALEGLSLEVQPGQIVGIFGGNGSGKSTLLKLLCGLLRKTGGELVISGASPDEAVRQDRIGYLPERPGYPGFNTARKLLVLYGKLSGLSGEILEKRVYDCLKQCRLEEQADVLIRKLSKGGIQRLAMAQVLIHDPEVLLLDEPVDGLDPLAREGVETLLRELREAGKTVILSTHLVAGLESLCDQVLILHQGRSIFCGPPEFETGMQSWILERLKEEEVVHD